MGFPMILASSLLLLLSALQISVQAPLRGVVQTQDKKPRVGADVFFISPSIPFLQKAEVLHIKSGKRGHFRISLSRRRSYFAWSSYQSSEGKIFSSQLAKDVQAGKLLILKEGKGRGSRKVFLQGLKAWGRSEMMEVNLGLNGKKLWDRWERVTSHSVVLFPDAFPQSARGYSFLLRKVGGRVLFGGTILFRKGKQNESLWRILPKGWAKRELQKRFLCPKPRLLRIYIQEKISKRPIPGAAVFFCQDEGPFYWMGQSDEKGRATLKAPMFSSTLKSLTLKVVKNGFSGSDAVLTNKSISMLGNFHLLKRAHPLEDLKFDLKKDHPLKGKVLGLDGKGLAGCVLKWRSSLYEPNEHNPIWYSVESTGFVQSDSNGEFQIQSIPPNLVHLRVSLFLSSKSWKILVGDQFPCPHTNVPIQSLHLNFLKNKHPHLHFDFRHFRILPFRVLSSDGEPVSFPCIYWVNGSHRLTAKPMVESRGGRRGKGSFLLPRDIPVVIFGAHPDQGYFWAKVPAAEKGDGFILPEKVVRLKPVTTFLSGQVVDSRGLPLGGVRIQEFGWSWSLGWDSRTLAAYGLNHIFLKGETNKNGRFKIPFMPNPQLSTTLRFSLGKRSNTLKVFNARDDLFVEL